MEDKARKPKCGMVDISGKKVTSRLAKASATVCLSRDAFTILFQDGSPKGDVFETARVAGIMAAKKTAEIIPLCHPLTLNKVNIAFEKEIKASMITIISEVKSDGRTGVEMEALTAVMAAALTIYDMMKWADKGIRVTDVKLLEKSGGKSGDYKRENSA